LHPRGGTLAQKQNKEEIKAIGSGGAGVASFILFGKFISIIVTGLSFIIVARVLGPSVYGVYTLIIGTMGLVTATGTFGVSTSINKFVSEYVHSGQRSKIGELIFNSIFPIFIIGLVVAGIVFLLSGFLSTQILHTGSYSNLVIISSFYIMLSMLYDTAYGALVGFGKRLASVQAIQSGSQAVISITLALLGFGAAAPIVGLELGLFFGLVAALLTIIIREGIRIVPKIDYQRLKEIFTFSLPIGVSGFLGAVANNIGIIILGVVSTTVVAGNFGVASKVAALLDLIIGSIYMASISMFSTAFMNKDNRTLVPKLYSYAFYVALVFVTPMVFYIAVLAKPFSYVAFSGLYKSGPEYIALVGLGILLGLLGTYAGALLISAGKVKKVLKYNAIVFVAEMAAILLLVPRFSGMGLIVSVYLVASLTTSAVFFWGIRRTFNVKLNLGKLSRVIIANLVAAGCMLVPYLVFPTYFIPVLVLGAAIEVAVYPLLLGITGAVGKEDVKRLSHVFGELPVFGGVVVRLLDYTSIFAR
jgi:O-antigen/teichoic acid export membrane protein